MKRKDLLAHLRVAGYHADTHAFTRLTVENRISIPAAREAYMVGVGQRGVTRCDCAACKSAATPAVAS